MGPVAVVVRASGEEYAAAVGGVVAGGHDLPRQVGVAAVDPGVHEADGEPGRAPGAVAADASLGPTGPGPHVGSRLAAVLPVVLDRPLVGGGVGRVAREVGVVGNGIDGGVLGAVELDEGHGLVGRVASSDRLHVLSVGDAYDLDGGVAQRPQHDPAVLLVGGLPLVGVGTRAPPHHEPLVRGGRGGGGGASDGFVLGQRGPRSERESGRGDQESREGYEEEGRPGAGHGVGAALVLGLGRPGPARDLRHVLHRHASEPR